MVRMPERRRAVDERDVVVLHDRADGPGHGVLAARRDSRWTSAPARSMVDGSSEQLVDFDEHVGGVGAVHEHVVHRAVERVGVGAQRVGEARLRVEVDEQDAQPALGHGGARGCGPWWSWPPHPSGSRRRSPGPRPASVGVARCPIRRRGAAGAGEYGRHAVRVVIRSVSLGAGLHRRRPWSPWRGRRPDRRSTPPTPPTSPSGRCRRAGFDGRGRRPARWPAGTRPEDGQVLDVWIVDAIVRRRRAASHHRAARAEVGRPASSTSTTASAPTQQDQLLSDEQFERLGRYEDDTYADRWALQNGLGSASAIVVVVVSVVLGRRTDTLWRRT